MIRAPAHIRRRGAAFGYCGAPGCAGCFYAQFMARPLLSLVLERIRLEHGRRVGRAWYGANYYRALLRAIADKRAGAVQLRALAELGGLTVGILYARREILRALEVWRDRAPSAAGPFTRDERKGTK